MDTATLSIKLDQILAATREAAIPLDARLWDAEQIGEYLHVSARQVAERYAIRPEYRFPEPIILPTESGRNNPRRWNAAEVIAWAEARRERRRAA